MYSSKYALTQIQGAAKDFENILLSKAGANFSRAVGILRGAHMLSDNHLPNHIASCFAAASAEKEMGSLMAREQSRNAIGYLIALAYHLDLREVRYKAMVALSRLSQNSAFRAKVQGDPEIWGMLLDCFFIVLDGGYKANRIAATSALYHFDALFLSHREKKGEGAIDEFMAGTDMFMRPRAIKLAPDKLAAAAGVLEKSGSEQQLLEIMGARFERWRSAEGFKNAVDTASWIYGYETRGKKNMLSMRVLASAFQRLAKTTQPDWVAQFKSGALMGSLIALTHNPDKEGVRRYAMLAFGHLSAIRSVREVICSYEGMKEVLVAHLAMRLTDDEAVKNKEAAMYVLHKFGALESQRGMVSKEIRAEIDGFLAERAKKGVATPKVSVGGGAGSSVSAPMFAAAVEVIAPASSEVGLLPSSTPF